MTFKQAIQRAVKISKLAGSQEVYIVMGDRAEYSVTSDWAVALDWGTPVAAYVNGQPL